jgi:hypothetical protein
MAKRAPAGEALTDLVLEVFRLNGRLLSVGDRMTRPVRQTSARWQVLGALETRALTVSGAVRATSAARISRKGAPSARAAWRAWAVRWTA